MKFSTLLITLHETTTLLGDTVEEVRDRFEKYRDETHLTSSNLHAKLIVRNAHNVAVAEIFFNGNIKLR